MPELILKNITKKFGDNLVLDDISLELKEGEFLVLLGPSGCGKSTCLRIISGLETADAGEIFFGSNRIDQLLPRDRNIAMVFQNYSLYPHMSVAKNLGFPLKVKGVNKKLIEEKVAEIAELIGLSEKLNQRPAELSGGQRQRVALGRAIIREPSIFLLDEPLSNLDADLRHRMRKEILRIQKKMGCTTVYVTHDQIEALTMADKIALLDDGKILQIGKPEELYNRPASLKVARFIGIPKINDIVCKIEDDKIVPFGLDLPPISKEFDKREIILAIRPEDLTIGTNGDLSAEVKQVEYVGNSYYVTLSYFDCSLVVSGCIQEYNIGEKVKFYLNSEKLLLFDTKTEKLLN